MNTEQETFDKLRRVDYAVACTEYTMVFMIYSSLHNDERCKEIAEVALRGLGWTINDLIEYEEKHNVI